MVTSDLGTGSHFTLELVAARVSAGLVRESAASPVPVVLWVTSDYSSTERIRDWVGGLGLGFVGVASTELTVKAAMEMRPAVIALDLPAELMSDMLTRVKDESKLTALPLLLVSEADVPAAELQESELKFEALLPLLAS